ncbi:hypothetical protein JTE90_016917 [Oedothorax gibbosus]|uniref:Uncharacterized protein n=1 Tax=Oedothorax gibbosus TaxID=931172 RepID=A0AAV6UTC2_9ARAC|nr:hypothetical protein JTE90_016917 [Oedothorax gibbosus]
MKTYILVSLFVVAMLFEVARADAEDMCPNVPCPEGKSCVKIGFVNMCLVTAGKGKKCSEYVLPDGSYKGSPPCQPGLVCPNNIGAQCE